jgi:radical SAM-linked protein
VSARQPQGPAPAPAVQRIALRYAKRGTLRFASGRDIARALERALHRAAVPLAYSAGFHPHPRLSYFGVAPTGAASEAEYLDIRLVEHREPDRVQSDLNHVLPPGLSILAAADGTSGLSTRLPELLQASLWRLTWAGVDAATLDAAIGEFCEVGRAIVERPARGPKSRARQLDARPAVLSITQPPNAAHPTKPGAAAPEGEGAGLVWDVIVRHVEQNVRPDDVVRAINQFRPNSQVEADVGSVSMQRLAQGPLNPGPSVADPFP